MSERHSSMDRVGVDSLAQYPDRIDVRSPAEFALDHVPGAINLPVLDDAERARVGTLYVTSPFAARKLGAAIVARNIAAMLERAVFDKPREWQPVIYCWRGGQRSRALAHVLNEIGWRARQLDGGYRAYRRHVVMELATAPARHRFVVVCGLTGAGKSRFLTALRGAGAQTLDLEELACHRGSLLGTLPGGGQPSQKGFETQLLCALEQLDPARAVFVESESKRIGALQLPLSLLERMRGGERLALATPLDTRVTLLKDEYAHFLRDSALLTSRLQPLAPLIGKAKLAEWSAMAEARDWDTLIAELLELHYDPLYVRSLKANFGSITASRTLDVRDASDAGFGALARETLRNFGLDFQPSSAATAA
jgi:tRNA 2-selenouridine synthase